MRAGLESDPPTLLRRHEKGKILSFFSSSSSSYVETRKRLFISTAAPQRERPRQSQCFSSLYYFAMPQLLGSILLLLVTFFSFPFMTD